MILKLKSDNSIRSWPLQSQHHQRRGLLLPSSQEPYQKVLEDPLLEILQAGTHDERMPGPASAE